MRVFRIMLLLFAPLWLAACDLLEPGSGYQRQVVVSGALEAGNGLPPINLTWTVAADQVYDPDQVTIPDAVLQITHLESGLVIDYRHFGEGPYYPRVGHAVVPEGTYRLEARIPGVSDPVTAETRVPPLFQIVGEPDGRLSFGRGQGPEVSITPSSDADHSAVYLQRIRALAADSFYVAEVEPGTYRWQEAGLPGRYGLTPFFRDIFLTNDCTPENDGTFSCDVDPADIVSSALPLVNEARYEVNPDGSLLIRVPWLGVGYYGPQELTISSIDEAMADFLETQGIQQTGGSNLSPGEIPNITTNIQGGVGVFGSYASQSFHLMVTEE